MTMKPTNGEAVSLNLSGPIRVCVAMPTRDEMNATTAFNLSDLMFVTRASGIEALHANIRATLVQHARNVLVKMAREQRASHIMFIDSDMAFPPTVLLHLLKQEKAIVGGAYPSRYKPNPLTIFKADMSPYTPSEIRGSSPFKVPYIGAGMLLIETRVFDTLERNDPESALWDTGYAPKQKVIWGEDIIFCQRVRALGYDVWCDPVVSRSIGHIGQAVFRIDTDRNTVSIG